MSSKASSADMTIPRMRHSRETLLFLGLNEVRADDIWERWSEIPRADLEDVEFLDFAKAVLRERILYDGSDVGAPDIDWTPALRQIGANEGLIKAVTGRDVIYNVVQLTKSAREWVEWAMDWRWKWVLHAHQLSDAKREDYASAQNSSPDRKHTGATDEDHTSECSISNISDSFSSECDLIPLWRTATALQAGRLCSGNGNTSSLDSLLSPPGSDFSGRRAVQCWTPDLEGVKLFAEYYKQIAAPAEIVLVRMKVPRSVLWQKSLALRYPNEDWKHLIFSSRRGRDPEPQELMRKVVGAEVLIGDVSTLNSVSVKELADWTAMEEKHLLRLPSGKAMTQVVFGHNMRGEFEDQIRELKCKVTIHAL